MTEPADTGALTPEAATAQRAELMRDAGFRQRATAGGAEWDQLAALNHAIAAGMEDAETHEPPAPPRAPVVQDEDGEDFAAFYTVPESPAGYELPTQLARERGLAVDPMVEIELRKSLHAAGVDGSLATTLYWAALNAQTNADRSPAGQETAYRAAAHELHRTWGKDYEANLALANAEARRLFEALPRSVTGGADFATFARASGMANSRLVVEELFSRAKTRTSK